MTNRAAATRYARALFEVSRDSGDPERTAVDLAAFANIIEGHATLRAALLNPAISSVRKRAVVDAILARTGTAGIVKRLLLMLAERDRLGLLPAIQESYGDRLLEHLGVVRARIATATPLEPSRIESMTRTLARLTGREVKIETEVDDTLVGGVVTQIGSTVFDGSVAHHLGRLRHRFLHDGATPRARN